MPDAVVKKSRIDGKGVFAGRAFKKGEEITSDYRKVPEPNMNMRCNCGSKKCRGLIRAKE